MMAGVLACSGGGGSEPRGRTVAKDAVMEAAGAPSSFIPSNFISFTLEGCRNDGSITLPIGGKFVCPDAAYTTGNLGKGWNELDLVPHRLTTSAGNQKGVTTLYDVYVAADTQTGGRIGYDVVSAPVVNAAKSDASCAVAAFDEATQGSATQPFGGGTDVVRYRQLEITQNANTTCVFDYYQRLALGSHLYPGSSLQSYMFQSAGLSGSKKTISIPVNQILPQTINKNESSTEGASFAWNLKKEPTSATYAWGDTCDPANLAPKTLSITVRWTKLPALLGSVTVIADVYATNPSARTISVNVTDTVYAGAAQTTALGSQSSGVIDIPPNTANFHILQQTVTADAGTDQFNDVATATYVDKVTGIPVPGDTEATANSSVQITYTNATATTTDVEWLVSPGSASLVPDAPPQITFSADSFLGASGSFDGGYVAGTPVRTVSWTSTSQSDTSSVTFNKTVYVSEPLEFVAVLKDVATLTGSDGFTTSAEAAINLSASPRTKLSIQKTVDTTIPVDRTFKFYVCAASATAPCTDANKVAEQDVVVKAGQTSASAVVEVAPGTYFVSEDPGDSRCTADADRKDATLTLPDHCTGSISFVNTCPKDLVVSKTAVPSLTRTYLWDLTKDVDKTRAPVAADGNGATFNYTVNVTGKGFTPSDWAVQGVVTIANPNGFDVSGVNVDDKIAGASCTFSGSNLTVKANGSIDVAYTCTFASAPAATGTNTASVTWPASFKTPSTSAQPSAGFDFGAVAAENLKEINKTVDVTDTLGGVLGSVTATTDGAVTPFKYSKTFAGVGGTCTSYDNTATIIQTSQSASKSVQVCVGKDLVVGKTAAGSYQRDHTWSITKNVDKTSESIAAGETHTFTYTIDVKATHLDSNWAVGGTITVTNPNDWESVDVNVADQFGDTCTVTPASLTVPASQSKTATYACSPGSSSHGWNTATATWDAAKYATPHGSGTATAEVVFAPPSPNNNATITVTDSYAGTLGTVSEDSTGDASHEFTYMRTESGVAGTCTTYDNTAKITETQQSASASARLCVGKDLLVQKTAAPSYTRQYYWSLAKVANKTRINVKEGGAAAQFDYTVTAKVTSVKDSGWKVSGDITVTNPNDWESVDVNVADQFGGTCTVTPASLTVPASQFKTAAYTCYPGSSPKGTNTNTATVTWDKAKYATPSAGGIGTASVTFGDPTSTTDQTINLTDTMGGSLGPVTSTIDGLQNGSAFERSFTYSHTFPGVAGTCTTYDNTATLTCSQPDQTASAQVMVCVGKDLTVDKTVLPAFMRTFNWNIAKGVTPGSAFLQAGNQAPFTWAVDVTQLAFTDSAWTVSGTITVSNPNDWEDIAGVTVNDTLSGGGACTVTGGSNVLVPKSGSVPLAYTCPASGQPGTNTATAAWDSDTYSTPFPSAHSGAVSFAFTTPTSEVNRTIHVTDPRAQPQELGVLTGTTSQPWASGHYTFGEGFVAPAGCISIPNAATIQELSLTANATAQVCGVRAEHQGDQDRPAVLEGHRYRHVRRDDPEHDAGARRDGAASPVVRLVHGHQGDEHHPPGDVRVARDGAELHVQLRLRRAARRRLRGHRSAADEHGDGDVPDRHRVGRVGLRHRERDAPPPAVHRRQDLRRAAGRAERTREVQHLVRQHR
jgi:hypothetical protein